MRCDLAFDSAQRIYVESFVRYDVNTFRSLLHPEVVTVLADGEIRRGLESVMAALAAHFDGRVAVCAWHELHRFVDDCRLAYIVYQTESMVPSQEADRALRGITYVREQDRWLVVADHATRLSDDGDDRRARKGLPTTAGLEAPQAIQHEDEDRLIRRGPFDWIRRFEGIAKESCPPSNA
jgi:hypothetical protein